MSDLISGANEIIWSPALVFLCLAAGLYFTIRLRLVQVRHIGGMLEQLRKDESSEAGVSSFQALAISSPAASAWATSVASPPRSPSAGPGPSSGCG